MQGPSTGRDPRTVKKFGGTSVGSVERIQAVAERLAEDIRAGEVPVVVVSAMAGETNRLIDLATSIAPRYRGPAYDMLLATGEQVSVALLAMALDQRGVRARPLLAHQLGIRTDAIFSKAKIQSINASKLESLVADGVVPIVAGFQGVAGEDITTLGRGGSDTTAVAIAAAMGLESCEIYTDVPAIFSADPRLVPAAVEMTSISFEEMMEMAVLGSKVLHFRSVELAAKYNVRIHLRSTFERRSGTWVLPEGEIMESPVVNSVTHDAATVVFKIHRLPAAPDTLWVLFSALAERGVVVDIIAHNEIEGRGMLAFSVTEEDRVISEDVTREVLGLSEVETIRDVAKLSIVGVGMKNHPGVAARFFKVLNQLGCRVYLVTTSEIKVSAVIDKRDLVRGAQQLHREFDLDAKEGVGT
jgi:aspartate kinase